MKNDFKILVNALREMKGFTNSPYIDFRENFESKLDEELTDAISFYKNKLKSSVILIWRNINNHLEISKLDDVWFRISSELISLGFPDPVRSSRLKNITDELKLQKEFISDELAERINQIIKDINKDNFKIPDTQNVNDYQHSLIEIWRILFIDYYKRDKAEFNYIINILIDVGLPWGL